MIETDVPHQTKPGQPLHRVTHLKLGLVRQVDNGHRLFGVLKHRHKPSVFPAGRTKRMFRNKIGLKPTASCVVKGQSLNRFFRRRQGLVGMERERSSTLVQQVQTPLNVRVIGLAGNGQDRTAGLTGDACRDHRAAVPSATDDTASEREMSDQFIADDLIDRVRRRLKRDGRQERAGRLPAVRKSLVHTGQLSSAVSFNPCPQGNDGPPPRVHGGTDRGRIDPEFTAVDDRHAALGQPRGELTRERRAILIAVRRAKQRNGYRIQGLNLATNPKRQRRRGRKPQQRRVLIVQQTNHPRRPIIQEPALFPHQTPQIGLSTTLEKRSCPLWITPGLSCKIVPRKSTQGCGTTETTQHVLDRRRVRVADGRYREDQRKQVHSLFVRVHRSIVHIKPNRLQQGIRSGSTQVLETGSSRTWRGLRQSDGNFANLVFAYREQSAQRHPRRDYR